MNYRNTIQRDMVFCAVQSLDHPSAEEVYLAIAARYPTISKATVYRNLRLLVEQGKLRRVALPDSADHYDFTLSRHYHISCKRCGKVVDAEWPYMHSLLEQLPSSHGFLIEEHDLILRGLCPDCQQKGLPDKPSVSSCPSAAPKQNIQIWRNRK